MLNNLRLKHGMFWRSTYPNLFSDYPGETRLFLLCCALLAALAVVGRVQADEVEYTTHSMQCEAKETLRQSYLDTLVACMNGDCRFQIGNELFELRGGSLGRAK